MKKFIFLPTIINYGLITVLVYSWLHYSFLINFFITILIVLAVYIFRSNSIPYRDTSKSDGELYLSPVHGVVEKIRQTSDGSVEVRISMSFWDEKGLYLPTAGEVSYLKAQAGEKVARNAGPEAFYRPSEELAHTDLSLTSRNDTKSLMRFIDTTLGKRPTIWLKSGDRGRGAACFGFYPLGGTLIIYLPKNSDILVFEKETIVPGQTVIAALKDAK
jgi:hypothetical protein